MDNLFKTKNKGKTVGYLKIIRGAVWMLNQDTYVKFCNENVTVDYADTTRWALYDYVECPDFDESLPYVCTDKNGVEIYINDEYKWYQPLVENGKQIRKEHRTIVKDDIVELFYLHNRTENCWGGVEVIGTIHDKEADNG